ncbi:MAG: hypothetical protein E2O39_15130 [Planctomycetota bacterium]|nr:MAG: hypothetical protein E2O39_15130 [Planctomycetota bacterium]
MSGLWRVFRAELGRHARQRSTYFIGLVLAALAGARALLAIGATAAERGGTIDPMTSGTAWAPFVDGWRAGLVLGALVLLSVAARSIAGDRDSGVLRLAVTRSASRVDLVWGRLLLAPVFVLALVAVTGAAAWGGARLGADFGPLVEDGYELLTAAELRAEVTRSVLAVLPALFATFAFGLFISTLATGATIAVTTALGVFLVFDLFKEVLGEARYYVFASYVPTLADTSAWAELPGVARGFSDAGFSAPLLRAALIVPWPGAVFFAAAACLVLSRRSL